MKKRRVGEGFVPLVAMLLALTFCGCLSISTKHKVEPIEITMNIRLSIDHELDRYLGAVEEGAKP